MTTTTMKIAIKTTCLVQMRRKKMSTSTTRKKVRVRTGRMTRERRARKAR
jgi:hypothetical protein